MRMLAAAVLSILVAGCGGTDDRVVVAAGTTLVDSGLIDALVVAYEDLHPGAEVSVVGESTATVLELGRRGAADVLITHAPVAEAAFLSSTAVERSVPLLTSRFLLVGPADRAATLSGLSAADAFASIADRGWRFVTRADGSGTHEAEMAVWQASGNDPAGSPWYLATGQGMGLSLQVASDRAAFTLAEEGTFRTAGARLALTVVELAGPPVPNSYTVTVLPGSRGAAEFVDWLQSTEGAAAIERLNVELFGAQVFGVADRL